MKSNNFFATLRSKLRNTVLSKLLVTYIAIMLVMLTAQSLVMGGIYQQQYYTDRVRTLLQEAGNLSIVTSQVLSTDSISSTVFSKAVYDVSKRQDATVWIVYWTGDVYQMKWDDTANNGSTADTVPEFKQFKGTGADFEQCLKRIVHGDNVTDVGLFRDLFGTDMMTIGVPIRYQNLNVPVGAVFILTKSQKMSEAVGTMYGHIGMSFLIAMALGIVLIGLMSTRISRPLAQMNAIARHIARGDFSRKADVRSRDEIGQLARSFNKMAEELKKQEDLRSGFVANVSHELRSPLTSIHGFAQGMLDGTISDSDHQKYLEVIVGETRRLNKLIRELLDLSQIESGKFPLNKQIFDVNELISRVLITFEEKIESKCIDIEVDFRQERAMVLADPDRIEQVVINLLDNAVKYTNKGGHIKIWSHAAVDKMLIGLSDDGPGIPEEDQPYIWERFYKVDKSHTGKQGTGLGLSIVKKIIDQHGERITVQSKSGGGTVFVFSLKRQDSPDKKTVGNQGE